MKIPSLKVQTDQDGFMIDNKLPKGSIVRKRKDVATKAQSLEEFKKEHPEAEGWGFHFDGTGSLFWMRRSKK